MITHQKLNIYRKYSGDFDALIRFGKKKDQQIINQQEWGIITILEQDLKLQAEGRLSNAYEEGLMARINSEVEDSSVLEALKKYELTSKKNPWWKFWLS